MAEAGRAFAAHAVLRSAAFLRGGNGPAPEIADHRVPESDLLAMEHNQYFRFRTLADKLDALSAGAPITVLDVGGGDGQLAQFVRQARYFLVEPSVNGIPGEDLPFGDETFDYVVSCHVLEHIPPAERYGFLDSLIRRARRGLVLLNPFFDPHTSVEERMRLFIQVTDAGWAKEHLDCTLPEIELMRQYAADRGLDIECEPNGFLPLSAAMVFSNYFCEQLGRRSDFRAINEFFNVRLSALLNSSECPNAYLVTLARR